ncbi:hypothetical protein BN8_03680 [Fibrisoma limi BUZ 3]|uniref:Uncharacterized protein n=1 Tax=Fibrisoma limi BUZ 3 TaxID=1185876 RepID=I2GKS8_9BACT|nr:hypothetical protein [Fibrisoma limi]CCH54504.1 hypothetical protein BN8_03680 [Fibrisoma limi BUZ 3]
MKSEIKFIEVRHQFTQDELNELGPIIARLNQEFQEKELEKKSAMSAFKHQLDTIKEAFNEACNKLNSGYEMREIRARMIKNYKTYQREYYSLDTFELVKTEPFKSYDYQRDIDDQEEDIDEEFGSVTDPTPEPQGTAETNPNQYTHLIRELNHWREKLVMLPQSEDPDDLQIDRGLRITAKIAELEAALKAMEPDHPQDPEKPDQSPQQPEASQSDDEPED